MQYNAGELENETVVDLYFPRTEIVIIIVCN